MGKVKEIEQEKSNLISQNEILESALSEFEIVIKEVKSMHKDLCKNCDFITKNAKLNDNSEVLKSSITVLQNVKDELEDRSSAETNEIESMVCEIRCFLAKVKKIEEENKDLINVKEIHESENVELRISLDVAKSKYEHIYKRLILVSTENEVLINTVDSLELTNTVLQSDQGEMEDRCNAAMIDNEDMICENKMLKEKIMKIEEEKNNLLKEKQRCGHDFSALQISMEERELEYEEICKRNEVTRTEIKV